ncbi:MAG: hypothetical protein QOG03_2410 [Actinomycetota bacterium]|nr:hypothetical protein [Actinomycetota bacterium]
MMMMIRVPRPMYMMSSSAGPSWTLGCALRVPADADL